MKCRIEIDLDNDAFLDYAGGPLADILREVAERLEDAGFDLRDLDYPLRDRNGNTCGRATVDIDDAERALADMVSMLELHGDRFIGNHAGEMAQEWIECGFDADTADDWCEIGCWAPTVAAQLRDAGKTPDQVAAAVESLIEEAGEDAGDRYTDGDPMYSACNRDTSIRVLIDACE